MIRSLYTSVSSMITNQQRQNIIANNMANINTIGYKEEQVLTKGFDEFHLSTNNNYINGNRYTKEIGSITPLNTIDEMSTNFNQGILEHTENNMDFAIDGDGFFIVMDDNQNKYYTRDGNFRVNVNGDLVTNEGYYVMGNNTENNNLEKINVGNKNINLSDDNVVYIDNIPRYELALVDFEEGDLNKFKDNLYVGQNAINSEANIMQGYLEKSNVNVINQTNNMMAFYREYEANQKVVQTIDSILDKISNEIGSVR